MVCNSLLKKHLGDMLQKTVIIKALQPDRESWIMNTLPYLISVKTNILAAVEVVKNSSSMRGCTKDFTFTFTFRAFSPKLLTLYIFQGQRQLVSSQGCCYCRCWGIPSGSEPILPHKINQLWNKCSITSDEHLTQPLLTVWNYCSIASRPSLGNDVLSLQCHLIYIYIYIFFFFYLPSCITQILWVWLKLEIRVTQH